MPPNSIAAAGTEIISALRAMVCARIDPVIQITALIDALRPSSASNHTLVNARVEALCEAMRQDAALRDALRATLIALLANRRQVSFYADSGMLPSSGFFSDLWRRMVQRVLPPISDTAYLKDCVNLIFHERDDYEWLGGIEHKLKVRFWHALQMQTQSNDPVLLESISEMLDAGDILAARIGAMGVEPELSRLYPRIEERGSPFLALAVETHDLAAAYRRYLAGGAQPIDDEQQIHVLIAQCREVLVRARKRAASLGTSLSATYLLRRLEQSLHRLETLVCLLALRHQVVETAADEQALIALWLEFLGHAIEGEARRKSIGSLVGRGIGLLALRVTDNASRTGEHYITSTRTEYFAMVRSAMGAGFLVVLMAILKIYSTTVALPPAGYALAFSLNYACFFMLMHVLHLTLATKQPAMTASVIAGAISETRGRARDLEKLATVITDVIRSQIAAILGNVLIALPTAMLFAFAIGQATGAPFMAGERAQLLLGAMSPFGSAALLYAAMAGVCLFLAGLISGYCDNLAAYERVRERVEHTLWLKKLLGVPAQNRIAAYLDNNLGALAGNFCLGVMLGSMGTIGYITGLPLDVAHVTISSAYFGLAIVSLQFSITLEAALHALLGIAMIGVVNLTVSFALALTVALRARGVGFGQAGALGTILFARMKNNGRRFFWPAAD